MTKEIVLPEGWEVDKIENSKIFLKEVRPRYPKTWEECYVQMEDGEYINSWSFILPLSPLSPKYANEEQHSTLPAGYGKKVLALCQLLICRNAYWGDWRPNWGSGETKYVIGKYRGAVTVEAVGHSNRILAFPTAEMRDTFMKNFKDLIEEAKDLL